MTTDLDRFNAIVKSANLTAEQERAVQMAASALATMLEQGPPAEDLAPPKGLAAPAAGHGVITAKAFWWGWHLDVPEDCVEDLLNGSEAVAAIIEAGLNVIPEIGELLGLAVNLYVKAMSLAIKAVDKGNGVYLSQTWALYAVILASGGIFGPPLIPVLFIPTTRKKK